MKIPNYCWSSNKGELHIHTIDTLGKLKEDTIVVKWKGFEKCKAEDLNQTLWLNIKYINFPESNFILSNSISLNNI